MARGRGRHLRRDALVFTGSLVGHLFVFWIAASEFTFYPPPQENAPPMEVEIVPQQTEIPPPPVPMIRLSPTPVPSPQPPAPQAAVKPEQVQPPTPVAAPPKPTIAPTAPIQAVHRAEPSPAPRAVATPTELAPSLSSEVEGPPKAVPLATIHSVQPQTAAAPRLVLHRARQEQGAPLAPSISIPGAVMAPPAQVNAGAAAGAVPGAGAPGGGPAGGGLQAGVLPGFGRGLRGGILGCANAEALHLSAAERARCAEAFGEGAKETPVMDPIAARRGELAGEAAQESAAEKYRDSTPNGTEAVPIAGQPRMFHTPGQ